MDVQQALNLEIFRQFEALNIHFAYLLPALFFSRVTTGRATMNHPIQIQYSLHIPRIHKSPHLNSTLF